MHPFVRAFKDECRNLGALYRIAAEYKKAIAARRPTKAILRKAHRIAAELKAPSNQEGRPGPGRVLTTKEG